MAKKVKGFMAEDGTFFESKAECEYYDARQVLEGLAIGNGYNIGAMGYIDWMEDNSEDVERFIKAVQVKRGHEAEVRDAEEFNEWAEREIDDGIASIGQSKNDPYPPNHIFGKEDTPPIQQQPSRVTEHLSDMGSGVGTKEVRNKRTKHGTRSRKRNA